MTKKHRRSKVKREIFSVNITVFEGRHYIWPNMNSYVAMRVGNKSTKTSVRYHSDAPYYNEFFEHEFYTTLDQLLEYPIVISVIQPNKCCKTLHSRTLGFISMDVATVWEQDDHQFYRKWAMLIESRGQGIGVRGYLLLTINILLKGHTAKIPTNPNSDNSIEANLLMPKGVSNERHRATFMFKIYKGLDILVKSAVGADIEVKVSDRFYKKSELPTTYVQIDFAGVKGKTKIKHHTHLPYWNEAICIAEMYPVLAQKIKIQLCFKYGLSGKYQKLARYLRMSSISSDMEYGYLPSFGPAFVHFYKDLGNGMEFSGKILMAIETRLFSLLRGGIKSVARETVPTILEPLLWDYENILLFATIHDISFINKKFRDKNISVRMAWGRKTDWRLDDYEPIYETDFYRMKTVDKNFYYVDFNTRFPCLHIVKLYPSFMRRLLNSNLIKNMAVKLKTQLDELEYLFTNNVFSSNSELIGTKLQALFDSLSAACGKYIDTVSPLQKFITDLDRSKTKYTLTEMREIQKLCQTLYNPRTKRKSYKNALNLYKRLLLLQDHPQECWPDIFFWLHIGEVDVASLQFSPNELVYSVNPDECGMYCGKVNTVYFRRERSNNRSDIICKMDVFLWLGRKHNEEQCFDMLPQSCEKWPDFVTVPKYLIIKEFKTFLGRVHIYQGRFLIAFDNTGLSDFFVRAVISEQSRTSTVQKATLSPLWDQTLVFCRVIVYGTEEQISSKPPVVALEIIDQDRCLQYDYVGHCQITPSVKFAKKPYSPPALAWMKVKHESVVVGEILAAAELLEMTEDCKEGGESPSIIPIPEEIRPSISKYKLEIMFWGLRDLKRSVNKPKVIVECSTEIMSSDAIRNFVINRNFADAVQTLDLFLPTNFEFVPPLSIKLYDTQGFGKSQYLGAHLTYIQHYIYYPITISDRQKRLSGDEKRKSFDSMQSISADAVIKIDVNQATYLTKLKDKHDLSQKKKIVALWLKLTKPLKLLSQHYHFKKSKKHQIPVEEFEDDEIDWWTKYYTAIETADPVALEQKKYHLVIFKSELEKQSKFSNLKDCLQSYKFYRGKTTGDELLDDAFTVGNLKCKIVTYVHPIEKEYVTPLGFPLENGYFQGYPPNNPEPFVVRIYCIKAISLAAKDKNGVCDSFIQIKMGKHTISDSKNHIPKNNNPIYGRSFELTGTFPKDHKVTVGVYDWDKSSTSDLIGQTIIDIENRFYTQHWAHCGLQFEYLGTGPCPWRDQLKPSEILQVICAKNNVEQPIYRNDSVQIGYKIFSPSIVKVTQPEKNTSGKRKPLELLKKKPTSETPVLTSTATQQLIEYDRETLALHALHNWNEMPVIGCHLVPEHVETRSLYNPAKLGIEQGKLQLWIDVFPVSELPLPAIVNISPRKPVSYELRVIIWNTDDVILNESDMFGDRKSDIYVKGWMADATEFQVTDVHYRSLTGEGNFNWRFIFRFDYLSAEKKIILKKKKKVFEIESAEQRLPCVLNLQVWDNDLFSKDDFLGYLTLDLSKIPRGAKTSHNCNLKIMDPTNPTVNLFKIKQTRGWWPFLTQATDKSVKKKGFAGKLDAELILLTQQEADGDPAGLGRSEPNPLPPPKRPDTSFNWFMNPLKTCKFIVWKGMKWKIITCLVFTVIILFAGLFLYSVPGYSVKKLLKA